MPGVPWQHPQILEDQLTLSEPGGADYAHHINTGTPGFSDLSTAITQTNPNQPNKPIKPTQISNTVFPQIVSALEYFPRQKFSLLGKKLRFEATI